MAMLGVYLGLHAGRSLLAHKCWTIVGLANSDQLCCLIYHRKKVFSTRPSKASELLFTILWFLCHFVTCCQVYKTAVSFIWAKLWSKFTHTFLQTRALCYKTNSRVKLLYKMGFFTQKSKFSNSIAVIIYSENESKIKIIPCTEF